MLVNGKMKCYLKLHLPRVNKLNFYEKSTQKEGENNLEWVEKSIGVQNFFSLF